MTKPRKVAGVAGLEPEPLGKLVQWFEEGVSFEKAAERSEGELGRKIPKSTLQRWWAHGRGLREALEGVEGEIEGAAEVARYAATGRAEFSAGTLFFFEKRLYELAVAHRSETDWERIEQLSCVLHRQRMGAVRERMSAVSERRMALKERSYDDSQGKGPKAITAENLEKMRQTNLDASLAAFGIARRVHAAMEAGDPNGAVIVDGVLYCRERPAPPGESHAKENGEEQKPHAKDAKSAKGEGENDPLNSKAPSPKINAETTEDTEQEKKNSPSVLSVSSVSPVSVPSAARPSHPLRAAFPARSERRGLLDYQFRFAFDFSRFKIGLWARQTGKDHTAAAEAVYDCAHHPDSTWLILAAGERQALETLAKARDWAGEQRLDAHDYLERPLSHWAASAGSTAARTRAGELRWKNGSRLIALPANAQTIRGYSANLILTEFAFHENPGEIWKAIYPAISNPLSGGPKKLRIISTPNGLNNKFAELWHQAEGYAKSKVTIHDAIRQGLPVDAAELEKHLGDPDAWKQEYLCEFADTAEVLLPYELITPCEHESAAASPDGVPSRGALFAGIDFGRKEHLTVCWIMERVPIHTFPLLNPRLPGALPGGPAPNYLVTREVMVLRNCPTPDQLDQLRPRLRHCQRVCVDASGPGIGLADHLAREFGEHVPGGRAGDPPARHGKVELCQFTPGLKNDLFPRLREAFEARQLAIPVEPEIREDLHLLQRRVSAEGKVSYRAARTPDGHADRATALALALRAAKLR